MTDLVFVAIAVAFFALCVGYVRACDRIVDAGGKQADEATPEPVHELEETMR
jgi:hypothetical protein